MSQSVTVPHCYLFYREIYRSDSLSSLLGLVGHHESWDWSSHTYKVGREGGGRTLCTVMIVISPPGLHISLLPPVPAESQLLL